ncbi:preprotein translocase subunit SecG [Persephonella sp.]
MEVLYTVLSILLVIIAVLLIIIILMQKTKGAEIGAIFGSGAAAAVLGAGASNILTKITYWLGGLFLFIVFSLSFIHHKSMKSPTVVDEIEVQDESPVTPKKPENKQ